MEHFPWVWVLSAFMFGGFLGFVIAALFASSTIAEVKLWNRRLQKERDDAVKDAENYREFLKNLSKAGIDASEAGIALRKVIAKNDKNIQEQ